MNGGQRRPTPEQTAGAAPLEPDDPRQVGGYQILGRLGEGGMGVVYLARRQDGLLVGLKRIHPWFARNPRFRARFVQEADHARRVPQSCTAEVLDVGHDADQPYLVTEYVDGRSLVEAVQTDGPLSPANLHSVAVGMAVALVAIHGAGVVHRDLKPSNVLLAPGSLKVIDFGIARALDATSGLTEPGRVVGTVAYMAPEQIDGTLGAVTAAADVFAWGATVTYAGTGRPPFGVADQDGLRDRVLHGAPDLGGLDAPLRGLVAAALDKDPARRPTARQLLEVLTGDATGAAPEHAAHRRGSAALAGVATRFRRHTVAYSAVAALLVVLLLALPPLLDRRPPPERPDPPRSAAVVTECSDEPPTDVRVDGRTVSVDYDVCVHMDEAGRFWATRRFTPDQPDLVTRQILTLKECAGDECPAIRAANGPLTSTRSGVAGRRYAACVWVDFVDGGQLPNRCSPKVPTPRPSVRQAG